MILAPQPVAAPASDDLEGVTDIEQGVIRLIHRAMWPIREPGGGERAQDSHIPQSAARLFQVRLDGLREVAMTDMPFGQRLAQLRQPFAGVGPPVVRDC